MKNKDWNIPYTRPVVSRTLKEAGFSPLLCQILALRGIESAEKANSLLYGGKALLFGLPAAGGISWLIWKVVDQGFVSGAYTPPWAAMGIAAGSVFLVVFSTMLYATRKIRKDNPIDALKTETL